MTEADELIERVSKTLGLPPEKLVSGSVKEYLKSRLRTTQAEINEIETKYNVQNPKNLEQKIKQGTIEEHPAWEDLILYENLQKQAEKIKQELKKIPN